MPPNVVSKSISQPLAKPSWNPLNCTGTDLPANLTVMVKMLAIVLLVTDHVRLMPDPWLPFLPQLAMIPGPIFKHTLQILFLVSAIAIVFNRRLRLFSLLLGSTILLAVLSSKAYYGNNKIFCGLMLFLSGCYMPEGPNFLGWQLGLTYFGAGLNKVLDVNWHTGIFFENWAVNRLHNAWYIAVSSKLPSMWLARFMCWSTIVTELGAVPLVLIPRLYFWGGLANILFQCCLLLFVGDTFTLFFYSMCGATLALVTWPNSPLLVVYGPGSQLCKRVRNAFQWLDFDRRFEWIPYRTDIGDNSGAEGLRLIAGDKTYDGFVALRMITLYNPITYFAIAAAIAGSRYLPRGEASLSRRLIVLIALVLLMPPLTWVVDRLRRNDGWPSKRLGARTIS